MQLRFQEMQRVKSLDKIKHDIDSLNQLYDSMGRMLSEQKPTSDYYGGLQRINKKDSLKDNQEGRAKLNFDTLYNKLPQDKKAHGGKPGTVVPYNRSFLTLISKRCQRAMQTT